MAHCSMFRIHSTFISSCILNPLRMSSATTSPLTVQAAIKRDHDYIRDTYARFKQTTNPDEHRKLANEFIRSVVIHSIAEEIIVYPVFEARLEHGKQIADQCREEHLVVKKALYDVDKMCGSEPDYDNRLDQIMVELAHHMQEEENTYLPKLASTCWEGELVSLAERFDGVKNKMPTHPHPSAPDRPPMETIVGMLQAPLDKMFDWLKRDFPAVKH